MNYIGIYTRKSIYSDKSDSVQTQLELCKDYVSRMYPDHNYKLIVYSADEGYTGANTDRPGYKKMMEDIEKNRVNLIICYKIDRISRDVKDFSNTFSIMQQHGVSFVSVKEQIDTTTPLGRAMMYICSVFAQMERETIAERVRDSSLALAKTGKWAGGKPPLGYKRERASLDGKEHTILVPNPEEIPFLQMIYDTFLEGYSLNRLEKKFRNDGVQTLKNNYFSASQIYSILSNPHVVENTAEIWDYFNLKGCIMAESRDFFDGKHGVVVYGRTNGGKKKPHYSNPPEKWLVCSGQHKPIVDAKKWLAVQSRFGLNIIDRTRKNNVGLLKGVLKCKCGWSMRTQHKVDKTYNKVYDNYFCQNRNTKGVAYCNMKFTSIDLLDNKVIDTLRTIVLDKSKLKQIAESIPVFDTTKKKNITHAIRSANAKISNLASALSENQDSAASKYIIAEMEKLDKKILALEAELRELNIVEIDTSKASMSLETTYNKICVFMDKFESLDYFAKNSFLNELLTECIWDGETLHIRI